jgi:flagellar protein FliO/FliZ
VGFGDVGPTVLVLLAVTAGAWAALVWMNGRRAARRVNLKLVERLPLDARRAICIAEVDGRRFLLGIGDGAPTLLAELSAGETG